MWNLRTACSHIDCRWQVFSSQKGEITATKFKYNYLRKKKIFFHLWNLHQIMNIFWKKDEAHSLHISEVIDSERSGYLNV